MQKPFELRLVIPVTSRHTAPLHIIMNLNEHMFEKETPYFPGIILDEWFCILSCLNKHERYPGRAAPTHRHSSLDDAEGIALDVSDWSTRVLSCHVTEQDSGAPFTLPMCRQ